MITEHIDFKNLMNKSDKGSYTIPSYQRPYSWKSQQWEGLFEDFTRMVKESLEVLPEKHSGNHFLGAVVRHQYNKDNNDDYYIVDGQQRILTTSLMALAWINALVDFYGHSELNNIRGDVSSLMNTLFMDLRTANTAEAGIQLKDQSRIRPLSRDAEPYYKVLLNVASNCNFDGLLDKYFDTYKDELKDRSKYELVEWDPKTSKLEEKAIGVEYAYAYFYYHATQFLDTKVNQYDKRMVMNEAVRILNTGFTFVTITVSHAERPQEIFESLNARSIPLTGFDLIKNYLLMSIETNDIKDMDSFYAENWEHFEIDDFWTSTLSEYLDKNIKGKIKKADQRTVFLNYWLEANTLISTPEEGWDKYLKQRESRDIDNRFDSDDNIFWAYRRHLQNKDAHEVKEFNERLSLDSKLFQQISNATIKDDIGQLCEEARGATEFSSMLDYPDLMKLCTSHNVPLILNFVDRCIVKLGYYSLWKIVLWIVSENQSSIPTVQSQEILKALESWVMRRELSGESRNSTAKGVNHILDYLNFIIAESPVHSSRAEKKLINYLKSNDSANLRWPTDEQMLTKARIDKSLTRYHPSIDLVDIVLRTVEDYERGFKQLSDPNHMGGLYRCDMSHGEVTLIIPEPKDKSYNWSDFDHFPTELEKIANQKLYTAQIGNYVLLPRSVTPVEDKEFSWLERKSYIERESRLNSEKSAFRYNRNLKDSKNWDNNAIASNTEGVVKIFNQLWKIPDS